MNGILKLKLYRSLQDCLKNFFAFTPFKNYVESKINEIL